jgi:hypothetical protein
MARPRAPRRDAFDLSETQPVTTLVEQTRVELYYDYDQLPDEHRPRVIQAAQTIKPRLKRAAEDLFVIGAELNAVKAAFVHGEFSRWLETEFGLSQRMAQHFMNVAARLLPKSEKFSLLSPSALYLLAAPSTPSAAIAQVEQLLDAGEHLPLRNVAQIVDAARAEAAPRDGSPLGADDHTLPPTIPSSDAERVIALSLHLEKAVKQLDRKTLAAWYDIMGDRRLAKAHRTLQRLLGELGVRMAQNVGAELRAYQLPLPPADDAP